MCLDYTIINDYNKNYSIAFIQQKKNNHKRIQTKNEIKYTIRMDIILTLIQMMNNQKIDKLLILRAEELAIAKSWFWFPNIRNKCTYAI